MNQGLSRRDLLAAPFGLALASLARAREGTPRKILLRSSWQTINIGDIAHTPGMLALIETHLPDAEVTLWPSSVDNGVQEMLMARFPKLRIIKAEAEKAKALEENDVCLHGSGPSIVAFRDLMRWQKTGKPYGIGGVTLTDDQIKNQRDLIAGAKFLFCRDTDSLRAAEAAKVPCPRMEFGPDATFFLDLKDDAKADAFLRAHDLEPKRFACFVPRLRWTPYWEEGRKVSAEERARKEKVNDESREVDAAKLRAAIVAWVRQTGQKALLCPEMTYQVKLLRPLLFDPLPDDVKPKVVARPGYWLTDEAASTYARASAVVSCEMHSPIIAIANHTPAIHLRQPTDTRKGQMWRDAGLGDWLFAIDDTTGDQVAAALLKLHAEPDATAAAVEKSRAFLAGRGKVMMDALAAAR
ncbi:polysaccharide pyruvyl transferase family protein [Tundrisphaera sp. TA3]|uniref:polysaccharide pyruvyl transferase family protein n=1 Tax=Tundrisphaera sp. TA3 TaxID=3435775 RepID=UPI003EBC24F2